MLPLCALSDGPFFYALRNPFQWRDDGVPLCHVRLQRVDGEAVELPQLIHSVAHILQAGVHHVVQIFSVCPPTNKTRLVPFIFLYAYAGADEGALLGIGHADLHAAIVRLRGHMPAVIYNGYFGIFHTVSNFKN